MIRNIEKSEKVKKEEKQIIVKSKSEFRRIKLQGGNPSLKTGCPECGDTENLIVNGRCITCYSCGWSKCSL